MPSMSKITTIAKLKVGQRFSFIPSEWFGPCKLTVKSEPQRHQKSYMFEKPEIWEDLFDIKFAANVVNPPGLIYGISGDTKVRLLGKKPRLSRKGYSAGYVV